MQPKYALLIEITERSTSIEQKGHTSKNCAVLTPVPPGVSSLDCLEYDALSSLSVKLHSLTRRLHR